MDLFFWSAGVARCRNPKASLGEGKAPTGCFFLRRQGVRALQPNTSALCFFLPARNLLLYVRFAFLLRVATVYRNIYIYI